MSPNKSDNASLGAPPEGDPWAAFGYLVAGVGFYGAIGFGLSVWLDSAFWIPVGILVGAAFGIYMVFARYRYRPDPTQTTSGGKNGTTPIDHDRRVAGDNVPDRPDRDDRGETR